MNLLELTGMFITVYLTVCQFLLRPPYPGASFSCRGDNVSAVAWFRRSGGTRNPRACVVLRLLGTIETVSGWSLKPAHVAGVLNPLADATSRRFDIDIGAELLRITGTPWTETVLPNELKRWVHELLQADAKHLTSAWEAQVSARIIELGSRTPAV
jgi:hypothetical protein